MEIHIIKLSKFLLTNFCLYPQESEEDSEDEEKEPVNEEKERNDKHLRKDHIRDRSRGKGIIFFKLF